MPGSFWSLAVAISGLLVPPTQGQTALSQARPIAPRFDVVAIRENRSTGWNMGMSLRGGSLHVHNLFLKSLITSGYGVREGLILGLPRWAEQARFDIQARVTDADPSMLNGISREQRRALMAAMLEDRFRLKAHVVTRTMPVYDLVVARHGAKFSESPPGVTGEGRNAAEPNVDVGKTEFTATGAPILTLSSLLEEIVGRAVLDRTGLTGIYDLHLQWAPDLTGTPDPDASPSIFTALRQQLGRELRPNKGPVNTLVVDHLERPVEN